MARFQAHDRIERNPEVLVGKPVIRGTRIPVDLIVREASMGRTFGEIVASYPRLTEEDVGAALAYAADFVSHEGLYSV